VDGASTRSDAQVRRVDCTSSRTVQWHAFHAADVVAPQQDVGDRVGLGASTDVRVVGRSECERGSRMPLREVRKGGRGSRPQFWSQLPPFTHCPVVDSSRSLDSRSVSTDKPGTSDRALEQRVDPQNRTPAGQRATVGPHTPVVRGQRRSVSGGLPRVVWHLASSSGLPSKLVITGLLTNLLTNRSDPGRSGRYSGGRWPRLRASDPGSTTLADTEQVNSAAPLCRIRL